MQITGSRIVVTGHKGLIGDALTKALADLDAYVYGLDLPECDVTDIDRIRKWMTNRFPDETVDGLVNCAAINPQLDEYASLSMLFETNILGTWNMLDSVYDYMIQGSIVNFGSLYGVVTPDPCMYKEAGIIDKPSGYTITKHAIHGMTKFYATRWAPAIRVNTISPGGVFNDQPAGFQIAYNKRVPMQRMADVEEIVHGVIFLLENDYINGHNLVIDGGYSAL